MSRAGPSVLARPSRGVVAATAALVVSVAVAGESAPEPMNRRVDQYPGRDAFLAAAAQFETQRLAAGPWRSDREDAFFARPEQTVAVRGATLRFRRIEPGSCLDGITPELKERLLSVPNRNHDLRRWADMFRPEERRRVTVAYPFYLSDTIVTNADFAAFVRDTGYRTTVERYATGWVVDAAAHWRQGFANAWDAQIYPGSEPDHPVVQVSWFDAMQFAAWLSRRSGVIFRVPTKAEWLLAARPAGQADQVCLFPWGNGFDDLDRRMNFGTAELRGYAWVHAQYHDGYARSSPVTAFPPNDRGLHDMLGNVWGWNWTPSDARAPAASPDRPPALAELGVDRNAPMAMTGGCYLARLTHANLLARMSHPALDGAEDIGFRLVAVRKADSGLADDQASTPPTPFLP